MVKDAFFSCPELLVTIYLLVEAPLTEAEPPSVKSTVPNVKFPFVKVKVPLTAVPVLRVNPALLFNVKLFADVTDAPVT